MKQIIVMLFISLFVLPALSDAAPVRLNVWPGLAPGEIDSKPGHPDKDTSGNIIRMADITGPWMEIYRPEGKGSHPAVMVMPGGGYYILADDLEGTEIAKWLNSCGYVAAVLRYRVPNKRTGALQDAQRALSTLRANAGKYGIDPHHLGVLGFSAGGHLTVKVSCDYDKRAYTPIDKIDKVSCRPDFALPIYPAYLINEKKEINSDVQPHAGMPPMFLMQTEDDSWYCVSEYSRALDKVGVKNRLVTYPKGGHGYGIRAGVDQPVHAWPKEAARWIAEQVKK